MTHRCHAHGCGTRVLSRLFMCPPHWRRVRPELRAAIWREYRTGQERRKDPSLRYLAVASLVIAEVAFRPHDESAAAAAWRYLARAHWARARAVAAGLGDPLEGLTTLEAPS